MIVKLDASTVTAAYSSAFQRFRALPGFSQKATLRAEAGSILKTWAGQVNVGTLARADTRARARAIRNAIGINRAGKNGSEISINSGRRGGTPGKVWFRTWATKRNGNQHRWQDAGVVTDAGVFKPSWKHYRPHDWGDAINYGAQRYAGWIKKLAPAARSSVGFARQSVIQIADDLGIDLNAVAGGGISAAGIAKARAAIASSGRVYKNGSGTEGGDDVKGYVQLINRLPYGFKIGLDQSLLRVVGGRAKKIEISYAKGTFDSMKEVAAQFPNVVRVYGGFGALLGN